MGRFHRITPRLPKVQRESLRLDPGAQEQLSEAVVDEIVKAYYPRLVAEADAARARGSNAYTIASAIAAALVAAGIFGGIQDRPTSVKLVLYFALALWLAAACGYIYAVAGTVKPTHTGVVGVKTFPYQVAENSRNAAAVIGFRLAVSQWLTVLAIVTTAAGLGLALFLPGTDETKAATVFLSQEGRRDLLALCGRSAPAITGRINPDELDGQFLRVTSAQPACPRAGREIRIRTSAIRSVALR